MEAMVASHHSGTVVTELVLNSPDPLPHATTRTTTTKARGRKCLRLPCLLRLGYYEAHGRQGLILPLLLLCYYSALTQRPVGAKVYNYHACYYSATTRPMGDKV